MAWNDLLPDRAVNGVNLVGSGIVAKPGQTLPPSDSTRCLTREQANILLEIVPIPSDNKLVLKRELIPKLTYKLIGNKGTQNDVSSANACALFTQQGSSLYTLSGNITIGESVYLDELGNTGTARFGFHAFTRDGVRLWIEVRDNQIASGIIINKGVCGTTDIPLDDFDYLVVRYGWQPAGGTDLDILVGYENNNTLSDNSYVGYGANNKLNPGSSDNDAMLWWALDNTSNQGVETVVIGIRNFINTYPNVGNIISVGIYASWFAALGTGDFSLSVVTYKGGTMIKQGTDLVNPTGVQVSSDTRNLQTNVRTVGSPTAANYYKVGTLKYNKTSNTAVLEIA